MMLEFSVQNVGTFYKNADKTTIPGATPLKVNIAPERYGELEKPLDLLLGCENFQDAGFGDKFDSFCDYLMRTNGKGSSLKHTIDSDFFSSRRNFVNIAASVYSWKFYRIQAIRKKGVIFLNDLREEAGDQYQDPRGYKFELYMTLDHNGNPFDDREPARNDECTKAVFRSTLKSEETAISMFYAAEIDAVNSYGDFIEMKTTALLGEKWREKKSLDVYLQARFGNCFQIIFGTKGHYKSQWSDHVCKVHKKMTTMLPGECREYWNEDECMERLFSTLQKVKTMLQNDGDSLVLTIKEKSIEIEPDNESDCSFLSQEFLEHFC